MDKQKIFLKGTVEGEVVVDEAEVQVDVAVEEEEEEVRVSVINY